MSARIISENLSTQLAEAIASYEAQGKRVTPLRVAGRTPFGRALRVGAAMPTGGPMANGSYAGGGGDYEGSCGCGDAVAVRKFMDRIGYPPCRVWGAPAPGGRDAIGCPTQKKLCIIPFPLRETVTAGATVQQYEVKAKVWYWPLAFVDGGSHAAITVRDLQYTGDAVFENGAGSGSWSPSGLFPAEGNWSIMPGLPAFDNSNGLVFTLGNTDAADQVFQGMFLGVSIRN